MTIQSLSDTELDDLLGSPSNVVPFRQEDNAAVAVDLARRGFRVFPITLKRHGKWTPVPGWQAAATSDPAAALEMFAHHPSARVGLRTGATTSLAVLDLDVKNGKDGIAELRALGLDPDTLSPVRVRTPSGGLHLFFRGDDSITGRTDVLAPGIDTRGRGNHVVAPGSWKNGARYEPLGAPLGSVDLPPWPDAIPRGRPPCRHADVDDDEADYRQIVERGELDRDLESGKLASALGAIDTDSYDDWIGIGMALHYASGADPTLLEMWQDWADGCQRWQRKVEKERETPAGLLRQMAVAWRGFDLNHPDPKTLSTVYGIARAGGWTWEESRAADDDMATLDGKPDAAKPEAAPRLRLLTPAECEAAPSRGYVVKGLLAPGDLAMIYGQPGTGKSLLAPFLGYMVALGDPVESPDAPAHPEPGELEGDGPTARRVFGLRTKRTGPVLYFAAEDPTGRRGRIKALRRRYGDAPAFRLVVGGTSLMPGSPDLARMREIVAEMRPALVFVDTLQMSFPAGPKMEAEKEAHYGAIVRAGRALAAHGAAVVLIHHPPKAGDTPRGSGVLNGALDVSVHIERGEDGVVRAAGGILPKNRNGSPHLDLAFRIEVEDGGVDGDGDRITLPVCKPLPKGDVVFRDLTPGERKALDVLRSLIAEARKCDTGDDAIRRISVDAWREACIAPGVMSPSEDRKSRARAFQRAREGLADKGRTRGDNETVGEISIDPSDLADGRHGRH